MFFSCRAKQPTPPPPRPHCAYSGCVHKVLRCEGPVKTRRVLSIFYACRSRTGEKMCTNPKQSGPSKYCEDPDVIPRAVPTNASLPTQTRTGHTAKARAASSQMCVFHTPLCLIPACGHPRVANGLYCPGHSCIETDCNSVIDGGNWCRDHRLCKTEGCKSPRVVSPGGTHEDACWFHLPTSCKAPGCVAVVSGGVPFCPQHECTYPPCRAQKDNANDALRLYCSSPADLANPSKPSSAQQPRFCVAHKCASSPDCAHPSKPASRRCALHACLYPSCPSPRAEDPLLVSASQFCAGHACRAPECHGAARSTGTFCDAEHACVVPGCPSPRRGVGTGGVEEEEKEGEEGGGGRVRVGAGPGSVCCAAHTAMIMARDTATGWTGFEPKSMPITPPPPPPPPHKQRFPYLSPTEEALGLRFQEERERHEQEARLAEETRAWHAVTTATDAAAAASRGGGGGVDVVGGVPLPAGFETRGKRARRQRSYDSGVAPSPTVSESTLSSNCTVVS
ncbi:hypothetical protein CORC01_02203 [Colletotrichum orchidophilum]|uniref:Uncharacterized protein n=1 Tax=Colletotrichum orchidophilum TaxID=1209926 RepID=A0A1G4BMI2_9PEZI|nr:uncharacterized protein CORC01_02203 [Colletotrichum orchidophilum]OHF02508.1 hypothetical protein CORC01_02203 [Colletotrichum orchidophilum]